MTDEVELLAGTKVSREPSTAIQACNDWLRIGAGRSLPALLERYAKKPQGEPPTDSLSTLKKWSAKYQWETRAKEYDAEIDKLKTAERDRIIREGLALDYERIKYLSKLAEFLSDQIYKRDGDAFINVWLPDVKSVRDGETFEKIDIVRFSGSLITQFRATLDDIAAEVGGRKQVLEHSAKDDKPIPIRLVEVVIDADVAGSDAADDISSDG